MPSFRDYIESEEFDKLDAVGKAEARASLFMRALQENEETRNTFLRANEEQRKQMADMFKQRLEKEYGDRFKVGAVEQDPSAVNRAARFVEKYAGVGPTPIKFMAGKARELTERPKDRPVFDIATERFISALNEGQIDPTAEDFADNDTFADTLRAINTLVDTGAVPATVRESWVGEAERRIEQGGGLSRAYGRAEAYSTGVLGTLGSLVDMTAPVNLPRTLTRFGLERITGQEQPTAQESLEGFAQNVRLSTAEPTQNLIDAARGDMIENWEGIGAVVPMLAGGFGSSAIIRGTMGMRGAPAVGREALVDLTMGASGSKYLPSIMGEMAGIDRDTYTGKALAAAEAGLASVVGNVLFSALGRSASPAIRKKAAETTAETLSEIANRIIRDAPDIEVGEIVQRVAREANVDPTVVAARELGAIEEAAAQARLAREESARAAEQIRRVETEAMADQGLATAPRVTDEPTPIDNFIRRAQEEAQDPSVLARQLDSEILQTTRRQADLDAAFAEGNQMVRRNEIPDELIPDEMARMPGAEGLREMPSELDLLNEFYRREERFNAGKILAEQTASVPPPFYLEPPPIRPDDILTIRSSTPIFFPRLPSQMQRQIVEEGVSQPTILGPTGMPVGRGPLSEMQFGGPRRPVMDEPAVTPRVTEEPAVAPRVAEEPTVGMKQYEVRSIGGIRNVVEAKDPASAARKGTATSTEFENATVIDLQSGKPYLKDFRSDKFVEDITSFRETTGPYVKSLEQSGLSDWADKQIRDSMGRLSANGFLDPNLFTAYAIKGAQLIGRGIKDFAKWSNQMVKDFGTLIKPHLQDIWESARNSIRPVSEPVTDALGRAKRSFVDVYNLGVGDFRQPMWKYVKDNMLDPIVAGKGDAMKKFEALRTRVMVQEPWAVNGVRHFHTYDKPILTRMYNEGAASINMPADDFRVVFKRYAEAMHGRDLNAIHGDGAAGWTNAQYAEFMRTLTPEQVAVFEPIRRQMRGLYDEALRVQYEGGFINQQTYDGLRESYPNYINFRRDVSDLTDAEFIQMVYQDGGAPARGVMKQFKGSQREVLDPMENLEWYYTNALNRTSRNQQVRLISNFLEENAEAFKGKPYRKILSMERPAFLKGKAKEQIDRASTRLENLPDDVIRELDSDLATAFSIERQTPSRVVRGKDGTAIPIYDKPPEGAIPYMDNGVRKLLRIKDNELAAAVTGAWANNPLFSSWPAKTLRLLTGSYSYMKTIGRAPEFASKMVIRDAKEVWFNLQRITGDTGMEAAQAIAKEYPDSLRSVFKGMALRNDLSDGFKAKTLKRMGMKIPSAADPDAQMYLEFARHAKPGGRGMAAIRNLDKAIEETNSMAIGRIKNGVFGMLENTVELAEDAMRFTVYKNLRKRGFSIEEASRGTWESSFNPFAKGALTNGITAIHIFAQTTAQSNRNFFASMAYKGGVITAKAAATVAAIESAAWVWNEMIYPGWHDVISEGDKHNSLVLVTGLREDGGPIIKTIPYAYVFHPFKRVANSLNRFSRPDTYERKSAAEEVGYLADGMISGMTPFTPGNLVNDAQSFALLQPLEQYRRNENWLNNKIFREPMAGGPNFNSYWPEFAETVTGKIMIAATKQLYDSTNNAMGDAILGAPVDIAPEGLDFLLKQYLGGMYEIPQSVTNLGGKLVDMLNGKPGVDLSRRDILVIRNWSKTVDADIAAQRRGLSKRAEADLREYIREKNDTRNRMESIALTARKLIKEDKADEAIEYIRSRVDAGDFSSEFELIDPQNAASFQRILANGIRRDRMDAEMRWLNSFGVQDGSRAQRILDRLMALPEQDRAAYWEAITAEPRPVATRRVVEQISELASNEEYMRRFAQ